MQIEGVFNRYLYDPDEYSGYAVIRLRIERGKYILGCSKECCVPLDLTEGTRLSLQGNYQEKKSTRSATGELVFAFTSIDVLMPTDKASAVEYLLGLNIKGIKDSYANKIINITGPNLSEYVLMNPDPSVLRKQLPLLSKATADTLYRRIQCATALKDFVTMLAPVGIQYKQSFRLYNKLSTVAGKELSVEEISHILSPDEQYCSRYATDVYKICESAGFMFCEADAVAKLFGFRPYNQTRIRSLVYAALQLAADAGHIWTTFKTVYTKIKKMTSRTAFPDVSISQYAIYSAIKNNPSLFKITSDGKVYLSSLYYDEKAIAYNTKRIKRTGKPLRYEGDITERLEKRHRIKYSESQQICFGFLRRGGLKIITGEAGTGKTTITSGLIEAYQALNPTKKIVLCAPTGRAAQRMTESCERFGLNIKASTIHRLLNFEPFGETNTAVYGENNPLDADFIIVDEMSMVDVTLFAMLLKAVKDGALVILCGDAAQLPSVSAGMVFHDLIDSELFETVKLSVNYRQAVDEANEGLIVRNAVMINKGSDDLKRGADFKIKVCKTEEDIKNEVIKIVQDNHDQTILSPIRNGEIGVNELNRIIQPLVNPNQDGYAFGKVKYKPGDKIIMNRNNYDADYVNGDVGTVLSVIPGGVMVQIGMAEKRITGDRLPDMSLAYAMTVHKSQGSEYDSVVIVLPQNAEHMLARNLIYTAITRAKQKVTVITMPGMLRKAIETTRDNERRTTLKEALIECNA